MVVDVEEEQKRILLQIDAVNNKESAKQAEIDIAQQVSFEMQSQLDRVVPLINQAIAQMNQISKYDVVEIRKMPHPPKPIKKVLKAVCIILGVEPVIKKNKRGEYKPSYWRAAISEKVLGDPNLPEVLCNFDKSSLTTETMGAVEDILSQADYSLESARYASAATMGLFQWVKAIRDYYYIFKEV